MALIVFLVIGLLAGWLASILTRTDRAHGLAEDLFFGVLGAFVAILFGYLFGIDTITGLNLTSLVLATIGAVVVIYAARRF